MGVGYIGGGPEVIRVSYGFQFKQFETIEEAMAYIKENFKLKFKHQFSIQRVNLQEIEIPNDRHISPS